ncbi:VOC family protein [Actinomadura graeca]|uniref:VOC family protein n=1 Tax=Actinomadura graeca TaxID=2750812 RepID=A0ABX8QVV5_9ACTN|nr:VOC family protein [Actinomadura graeca]QXJ21582.1 VOC family protein [Actinomadura graeca]
MPTVTGYLAGDPCWADLATPDLGASMAFYCELFGWSSYTLTVGTLGDYEMFTLGGTQGPAVAGMQVLDDDTQPPSWTCYVHADDTDLTHRAVLDAGGGTLIEPTSVANLGRMAVCADTQGADFGIWEGWDLPGADVTDEPSAMCWFELCCVDTGEAKRFYDEVFAWKGVDRVYDRWSASEQGYHPAVYTDWMHGDRPVGGMFFMDELWPERRPAYWIPYFWVADCDASAAAALDLGGEIAIPPNDAVHGRFSILTDPTGARVGIFTPSAAVLEDVRTRPRHMEP